MRHTKTCWTFPEVWRMEPDGKGAACMNRYLDDLIARYPALTEIGEQIRESYEILERCYAGGHKLLIAGNGGSAADAEHIAGELMKGFRSKRPVPEEFARRLAEIDPVLGKSLAENLEGTLRAVALVTHEALSTAYLNDRDPYGVFAQQLYGLGDPEDVFLGISTSGNSRNILNAAVVAKAKGMTVIGLTGRTGGALKKLADVTIAVPETETYKIQELHLPIYHCLCLMLEARFFP